MSVLLDGRRIRGITSIRLTVCGTVVLIGLLVLGPRPTRAAASSPDSLSAAVVAFELRYGPASHLAKPPPPSSRDRWVARDKARHVVFSGLWTLSTQYLLVRKADWSEGDALPVSVASSATVGLAKELYDASRPGGQASGKDLVADAVGIGLAVCVIAL